MHRLVRGPLRAPADGGRLPPEREPQSAEREHHEPEDGLRGQSRAEESRPRHVDDDVPVVRVPGDAGDPLEDGAPSVGLDGAAGSPAELRQRDQRGSGAAQGRADSLAPARVEDDVSRPGIDDRDVEAARLSHDGLAQRLDRDLEVEDGAAHAADGDGGRSGDDPRVRVRRDVRRHLIGLAGRQAERRADEGVGALTGGERRKGGGDAVLESCHLAPVRRDEAGLADRLAVGGPERPKCSVDLARGPRVRADGLLQRPRSSEHIAPDRAGGAHEDDRALPREVVREQLRLSRRRGVEARSLIPAGGLVRCVDQEGGAKSERQEAGDHHDDDPASVVTQTRPERLPVGEDGHSSGGRSPSGDLERPVRVPPLCGTTTTRMRAEPALEGGRSAAGRARPEEGAVEVDVELDGREPVRRRIHRAAVGREPMARTARLPGAAHEPVLAVLGLPHPLAL